MSVQVSSLDREIGRFYQCYDRWAVCVEILLSLAGRERRRWLE